MTDRYPYRHHGQAVHGSKLADYLISEANMTDDLEQLRAENARLRRRLADCIVWMDTREEAQPGMPRLCDMARAALSADPAPVGDAWRPIDSITPDAGHVLLFGSTRHDSGVIFTGWIAKNGMLYSDTWGLDHKPTHWMPLPPPPAGENGNENG